MNRKVIGRVLLASLMSMAVVSIGGEASAQEEVAASARDGGPIVRHKLLYRSTRFEATPFLGMTLNDAFLRNSMVGGQFAYHLTNEFGIAFTAGFSPFQLETDLYNNVEAELRREGQQADLQNTSLSFLQWLAGLEVQYVPLFGKFSVGQSLIANYDLHLILGVAAVGQDARLMDDSGGGTVDSQLTGLTPSPVFGVGFRLFTSDSLSISVQARDYLFSRAVISRQAAETELTNNVLVSVGASFFFPGEVKISR